MPRLAPIIVNSLLLIVSTLAAFLIGETLLRWSQYAQFSVDVFTLDNRGPLLIDPRLGWRAMPDYHRQGEWHDLAGVEYPLSMSTNKDGFRMFGDVASDKPKILIVGDSYTHAIETSDGETYFHRMADVLPFEFFVYGAGGYGTLQEYLVIEEFWDVIQPDLLLIQFCGNDLSNNLQAYEAIDLGNNNGLIRPYLSPSGEIYYDIARDNKALWGIANRYSKLLAALMFRWDIATFEPPSQPEIAAIHEDAIGVTGKILRMLKERAASIPVYAFSTDAGPETYDVFRDLSFANGIVFVEGVPQALRRAEEAGLVGRVADGAHWSPEGHRAIAMPLIRFFSGQLEAEVPVRTQR